jgi:hypothetical protein
MDQEAQSLSPQEEQERQRRRDIMDKNYEILQNLEHRDVVISSNRYDDEDREYYVQEVERTYLDGTSGYIPSVRLINNEVRHSLQPVLKMPRSLISVDNSGQTQTLALIYSSQPSVEHSFHFMNRHERPDLEIYISYEK